MSNSIEEKISYLEQYSDTVLTLQRLDAELKEEEAAIRYGRSFIGGMPTGSDRRSKIEKHILKLEGIREQVAEELQAKDNLRHEITECIEALPEEGQRSVLYYHYITGLTWEQVAEKIYVSKQTALNWRKKAMTALVIKK